MTLNPLTCMHATIINMYFCMKITLFYSRLCQNSHKNVSIVNVFKTRYTPKRTKLHHFKKNSLGGHAPEPPKQSAWLRFATCKFPNLKKKLPPPPLPNPGYVPDDKYAFR